MAKFKADQLNELIRTIVRQEVRRVEESLHESIAKTMNEILSERYLRHLAETAAPRGVGRTVHRADDVIEPEDVPHIAPQTFGGKDIYDQHPSKHDDEIDEEVELQAENLERNDMLSLFFEGTKPLEEVEGDAEEGIPMQAVAPKIKGRKPMEEVWKTLAGVKREPAKQASAPIDKETLEAREEKRLKMLRESLERPVT